MKALGGSGSLWSLQGRTSRCSSASGGVRLWFVWLAAAAAQPPASVTTGHHFLCLLCLHVCHGLLESIRCGLRAHPDTSTNNSYSNPVTKNITQAHFIGASNFLSGRSPHKFPRCIGNSSWEGEWNPKLTQFSHPDVWFLLLSGPLIPHA